MISYVPFLWKKLPKKFLGVTLSDFCFLCVCRLNKDKVRVFGKSAVVVSGLSKSATTLFVC